MGFTMILSEVITLAKSAELKQLAIKTDDITVLGFANLGILELHKRFKLIQQEATITMVDGVSDYLIDGSDANVTIDLSEYDILTVDEVYNHDDDQLMLNGFGTDSVKHRSYNKIGIPDSLLVAGETVKVVYRAAPKTIVDVAATLPLPRQFTEALLHYIGYRAHSSLYGDTKTENNTHYMRFDKSCRLITAQNLYNSDSMETDKFERRGFV